jgi:hypothetical protein
VAPPAPLLRRRAAGPRRPPPAAVARRTKALGHPGHRRDHPSAGPRVRPTSPNATTTMEGEHQGPWNPAHPSRQPGSQAHPAQKITHQPIPQARTPETRNIEANLWPGI